MTGLVTFGRRYYGDAFKLFEVNAWQVYYTQEPGPYTHVGPPIKGWIIV